MLLTSASMNTLRISLSAALLALAVNGCGASTKGGATGEDPGTDTTPTVSATANITTGVAPLEIEFTGLAAGGNGALTYEWDFGDGETSTQISPNHSYGAAGTFSAKFKATDEDGDFAAATVTINVGTESLPAVTAAADVTQGLAPLNVQFTSTIVGGDAPVTVSWNFGDGETSAEAAPAHIFNTPGSYGATVTATDATGDSAQATVLITVGSDAVPVVAISATPTSGAAPLPVAFTASVAGGNGTLTYAWSFGDATTATTMNANHTYTADGSFQAKLTVTDEDGDTAAANVTIVVNSNQAAMLPDLQVGTWDAFGSGLDDVYEPNDTVATYLGDWENSPYSISNAYIDEVDVTYYVDVVNFGKALNTPFDVDFYQHAPGGPGVTVYGDDWETVNSLAENATQRIYFTVFNVEPDVTNSSYARLDTFDDIEESVETNNLSMNLDVTAFPDVDWFAVDQDAGFDITVALSSLPADYDVEIYDPSGAFLADSASAGTTSELVTVTAPATGFYYIRIFGYNGARSSSDSYLLDVTVE